MENNFIFFSLSIFKTTSLHSIKSAVECIFKEDFIKGSAFFTDEQLNIDEYINPQMGGYIKDKFCCWKNPLYPDTVFFVSNSIDGRETLCNVIQEKTQCTHIRFVFSDGKKYPYYEFHYKNNKDVSREVLLYKESKWTFFEKGDILPFETPAYYNSKSVRNRLNNNILFSYLKCLGYDFSLIDGNTESCFVCYGA